MRLVFVTQAVDADDPNLGATVSKLRALASRCSELHVVCARLGQHDLPPNCTIETFGAATRAGRGLRFLRATAPALVCRPDGLIAHMCPIYLVLAAPFAKPLGVPLVLWYTHWASDDTLRIATRLCDVALTVDRGSFPITSPKVRAIGHGIDTREFRPTETPTTHDGRLSLIALGRTSPSKDFPTLLEALRRVGDNVDATLDLLGPSLTDEERRHREELEHKIAENGLHGRVRLGLPRPRADVPKLLRGRDALVNTTLAQRAGAALDKVVFEAAACGVPAIACNPQFACFLGDLPVELRFRSGDADDLARVLTAFAAADPDLRAAAGRELRRRVEIGHSVETWADGVVAAVRDLSA